jgi:hypothetical protein
MRPAPESTSRTERRATQKPRGRLARRIRARASSEPSTVSIPIDARPAGVATFSGSGRTAVTAAAQVLNTPSIARKKIRPGRQPWQQEAWQLRRVTGEMRFAGDRQARAVAQTRLFIAERTEPGADPTPVTDDPTIVALSEAMFGDAAAVQQSLKRAAQHIIHNGETTIIVKQDGERFTWSAHSVSEVSGQAGSWKINDGITTRNVDDSEILIRCWTPDPEFEQLADSPVRAILPHARELEGLGKYVSAQIDSRLAGAGLLAIPEGLSVVRPASTGGDDEDDDKPDDDYTLADELADAMITPLTDRESAASVVPFIIEGPADQLEKIQHITFDSPLDENAPKLREELIRRIALGMDSDPSVVLGMATSNHWTGWLISEDEVRLGVAPIDGTLCHAFTVGWLRPMFEELGLDTNRYQVWYDTTPLELRPDRSKDAQSLHEKGAVSDETLRRENGFGDDDAPSKEEQERNLLIQLLIGAPTLAPILLPKLGIEIAQPVLDEAKDIKDVVDGTDTAPAADTTPPAPVTDNTPPGTKDTPPPAAESGA